MIHLWNISTILQSETMEEIGATFVIEGVMLLLTVAFCLFRIIFWLGVVKEKRKERQKKVYIE